MKIKRIFIKEGRMLRRFPSNRTIRTPYVSAASYCQYEAVFLFLVYCTMFPTCTQSHNGEYGLFASYFMNPYPRNPYPKLSIIIKIILQISIKISKKISSALADSSWFALGSRQIARRGLRPCISAPFGRLSKSIFSCQDPYIRQR